MPTGKQKIKLIFKWRMYEIEIMCDNWRFERGNIFFLAVRNLQAQRLPPTVAGKDTSEVELVPARKEREKAVRESLSWKKTASFMRCSKNTSVYAMIVTDDRITIICERMIIMKHQTRE